MGSRHALRPALVLLALCTAVGCAPPAARPPLDPVPNVPWFADLRSGLVALDGELDRLDEELERAEQEGRSDRERLALLFERDVQVDRAWSELTGPIPTHALAYAERELLSRIDLVRRDNLARLAPLLETRGWFTRSESGAEADREAWTIVLHADHDPELQREVLLLLEGLAEIGETDPVHVAYLTDRIAVGDGEPQVYGTQGRCTDGVWVPDPIAGPDGVDTRRAEFGLPPLEEQIAAASRDCR